MSETSMSEAVKDYVKKHVRYEVRNLNQDWSGRVYLLIVKAFSLLPQDVLNLFMAEARSLTIRIMPNPGFPLGMRTTSQGPIDARNYTIVMYREHLDMEENRFIGSFLRELGHAVIQSPPESEWPASKAERSQLKEMLELRADAAVWSWGLRHYGMAYLWGTYPSHVADRIVADIEHLLKDEGPIGID
jgi:hypothetical protein